MTLLSQERVDGVDGMAVAVKGDVDVAARHEEDGGGYKDAEG